MCVREREALIHHHNSRCRPDNALVAIQQQNTHLRSSTSSLCALHCTTESLILDRSTGLELLKQRAALNGLLLLVVV